MCDAWSCGFVWRLIKKWKISICSRRKLRAWSNTRLSLIVGGWGGGGGEVIFKFFTKNFDLLSPPPSKYCNSSLYHVSMNFPANFCRIRKILYIHIFFKTSFTDYIGNSSLILMLILVIFSYIFSFNVLIKKETHCEKRLFLQNV